MTARLYSNENFPLPVVAALRGYGHDVLTTLDAGKANDAIPDDEVLDFATQNERAVLTHNRQDKSGEPLKADRELIAALQQAKQALTSEDGEGGQFFIRSRFGGASARGCARSAWGWLRPSRS